MKYFYLIFLTFIWNGLFSQIIISEYSASNLRMFPDDYGKYEDWIELHNTGNTSVDISGWYLSDKRDKPKKWKIPSGTTLGPDNYIIIWASGRDEITPTDFHTNFKFTQSKNDEFVVLSNSGGNIIESAPLIITQNHQSVSKSSTDNNVWYISTEPTPGSEAIEEKLFSAYTSRPTINTNAGFYKDSILVSVSQPPNEVLRYTLDGSLPSDSSEVFNGNLVIRETAVLSVRSFSPDPAILPGLIDFKTYFINEPTQTLPVISLGAGEELILLAEGDREQTPFGSCEVFSKEGELKSRSYGELDRHGQDSWINDQRSLDWISRDEMGYDSGLPQKLFSYSERDQYQRIILRASGDDNYPSVGDEDHEGSTHIRDEYVHELVKKSGMNMDVRASERYLVYLNGKYWGVYAIREKPDDHDYTDYTYKQDKYDIQFLKTWGQSWVEYGDQQAIDDWQNFRDYILNNDVSQEGVYDKITGEMDVVSLADYMIANLTCVSSDWLNYNTGWWRGLKPQGGHKKWGYIMWDNDATFDYYINYSGVPDISPNAKACDIEEISVFMDEFFPLDTTLVQYEDDSIFIDGTWYYFEGDTFLVFPDLGKHEKIFLKLLEDNPDFRNLYFARYADMFNTTFSCESMIYILDSMVNIIRPEMPRHIARWGGSMFEWESNIKRLRDFIIKRCNRIDDGLKACYNLTGTYEVTLMTDPPESGAVRLNTKTHTSLPWSGEYFGNMINEVEIIPSAGKKFLYWVSKNEGIVINHSSLLKTGIEIISRDTMVAVFEGSVSTENFNIAKVNLSPNPAGFMVNVSFENENVTSVDYKIVAADGRIVQTGIQSSMDASFILDVSQIPVGSYIIHLTTDNVSSMEKLIIMR
ncbi:MAG: CotH kinase family protein [Saprospiraceae bacterium]|nr:CotH kinase family protein [Saprospiraceae bacterium]